MGHNVRYTLIGIGMILAVVGGYHRLQSQRSGEPLDRSKEGWPILIGLRLAGLLTLGSTVAWLWNPEWFTAVALETPEPVRWIGVAVFACGIALMCWMFRALGPNLTDTVVTRRDAKFVDAGPYRYVRNPMYTGVLIIGLGLGLALGTWLIPLCATATFVMMVFRTHIEERYLIERFGEQYRCYMSAVGRFFPKLRQH